MTDFFHCPGGHKLPHVGESGTCSPVKCCDKKTAVKPEVSASSSKRAIKALAKAELPPEEVTEKERRLLEAKKTVALARQEFVKLPKGLEGAAADEYATKKLVELTPMALAEVEFQLLYGTDDQRSKMALEVLDRSGHGRKTDSQGLGGPVIIITGSPKLPWAPAQVVSGEVISEQKVESPKKA